MVGDSIWEIDIRTGSRVVAQFCAISARMGLGRFLPGSSVIAPLRFDPAEMRREIRSAKRQLQIGVRELSSPALP